MKRKLIKRIIKPYYMKIKGKRRKINGYWRIDYDNKHNGTNRNRMD